MVPPFFHEPHRSPVQGDLTGSVQKEFRQRSTAGVYRDADLIMLAKEK
jgi:hypothetical protein